jgi:hypothetical protein
MMDMFSIPSYKRHHAQLHHRRRLRVHRRLSLKVRKLISALDATQNRARKIGDGNGDPRVSQMPVVKIVNFAGFMSRAAAFTFSIAIQIRRGGWPHVSREGGTP